jgi:hypothetical protein
MKKVVVFLFFLFLIIGCGQNVDLKTIISHGPQYRIASDSLWKIQKEMAEFSKKGKYSREYEQKMMIRMSPFIHTIDSLLAIADD